ncbi:hypothetical protein MAR_029134, partial [Mya arenaria]
MRIFCSLQLTGNVFLILGLCLALGGVCGPAWFRTSHPPGPDPTWTLEEGIWLARFCRHKTGECIFTVRERVFSEIGIARSLSPLDETHWLEFKALSVASLLSGFVAIVTAALTLTETNKSDMTTRDLLLISILMLFVPVLKVAHVTTKISYFGKTSDCWSIVLATTGAACMYAASACFVLAVTKAAFNLYDQKSRRRERHRGLDEQLRRNEIIARHFYDANGTFVSPSDENLIVNNELRVSADSDSAYSVISNGGLTERNNANAYIICINIILYVGSEH